MNLLELFENPYDWTLAEDGPMKKIYVLHLPNRDLIMKFSQRIKYAAWYIYLEEPNGTDIPKGQSGSDRSQHFRTWSTALACLTHMLKTFRPLKAQFTGSTRDLKRLYAAAMEDLEEAVEPLGYSVTTAPGYFGGTYIVVERPEEDEDIHEGFTRLLELGDRSVNFTKHGDFRQDPEVHYFFDVRGVTFKALFERGTTESPVSTYQGEAWEMSFDRYETEDENAPEDKRLAVAVLSTMLNILVDFLETASPECVTFYGASERLGEVYTASKPTISKAVAPLGYIVKRNRIDGPFKWTFFDIVKDDLGQTY